MEFHLYAPEKEKVVLKRSILGLGNIIVREERLFELTKRDVGDTVEHDFCMP